MSDLQVLLAFSVAMGVMLSVLVCNAIWEDSDMSLVRNIISSLAYLLDRYVFHCRFVWLCRLTTIGYLDLPDDDE